MINMKRNNRFTASLRAISKSRSSKKCNSSRKAVRQKTLGGSGDSSAEGTTVRRTSSMPSLCDAITQDGATTSAMKPYDYESKLNKLQRRGLRFTWHRLQTRNGGKRVENVFEEVFDRLIRYLPQIRDMFTTRMFLCAMSRNEMASLRDHAKVTVKMFDNVIKNLDVEKSKRTDTGTELDPRMIGRAHGSLRPYGLTGTYWEKLGEVIIDVVLAQEAVRDLPGAGQAWVILTACVVDQLRAGFEENRNTQHAVFPKQSTVLHHATRHLHNESTDSDGPHHQQEEPHQACPMRPEPSEGVAGLARRLHQMPFSPKIKRHQSVAEEHPSSSSSSIHSCPFESRGSLKEHANQSPEQPAITIN
ncbi:unnamed protein product [Auanema sp. JU1783]|nr:unnamed protein product [Auanema sp. JU1783]